MHAMNDRNPIAVTAYFFAVIFITMFSMNPAVVTLSLFGSIVLSVTLRSVKSAKTHLWLVVFFLVMTLLNPLFNHNGMTVLFFFNGRAFTLEALFYGAAAAGVIIAVLYWFFSYTKIMTSEKLLYLFGKISPKLSLILSMSIRFVSLFSDHLKKTENAQKALGLYKNDNIIDTVKGKARVFSITVTWALESGIVTAESMEARGYGAKRRTYFSVFKFQTEDAMLTALSIALAALTAAGGYFTDFSYYPSVSYTVSPLSYIGIISFGVLVIIPEIIHIKEGIRWKYYMSKI